MFRHKRAIQQQLAGLLTFGILGWIQIANLDGQPPDRSPVQVTEAISRSLRETIELPGSVEPRTLSTLASEIRGLVVELPVREGDHIQKGQILAKLRTETLKLDLAAAEAQLREDESRRKLAEINLKRAKELREERVLSQQQLDDARFEHNAWEGRIQRLEVQIERINEDLKRSTVRAPFEGVVLRKFTEIGQWVIEGGPVVEVLSLADLEIHVAVPERYFTALSRRGSAVVRFDSLPEVQISAPIAALIPRADPQARTFPVRLALPTSQKRFSAGMTAQVSFPFGATSKAILVPKDAVVSSGGPPTLFRLTAQNTVEKVSVETGRGMGQWISVEGGIEPGDRVVTRGNERLRPGQPVAPTPLKYPLP